MKYTSWTFWERKFSIRSPSRVATGQFKNENHISWLNGEPWVCSPDLLTLAYQENGEGTTNTLIKEDDTVVAVGMKGLEVFRTEFGLNKASGPRYFGFDIDYVPVEILAKKRR